jgi:hypothetical protein
VNPGVTKRGSADSPLKFGWKQTGAAKRPVQSPVRNTLGNSASGEVVRVRGDADQQSGMRLRASDMWPAVSGLPSGQLCRGRRLRPWQVKLPHKCPEPRIVVQRFEQGVGLDA